MKTRLLTGLFLLLGLTGFSQENILTRVASLVNDGAYEQATALIEQSLPGADAEGTIRLNNKRAEILTLQGRLNDAETLLTELHQGPANGNPFLLAETKTNLGFLYLNKARNDMALTSLQEALALYQRAGKENSVESARCLATLSFVYLTTGKNNQAEENGLVALQLRQRLLGEASEEVAASYNDLGLVYGQTNPDKALEYYEMAMAVYEKLHGKEHRKMAIASTNVGTAYRKLKLYGDAITNFETAEAIWQRIYPEGHPATAFTLVNLGLTYDNMGNHTAALGYFERALALYRKSYGERHSDIAYVLNQMGLIKQDEKKFDEALGLYQQALMANSPVFSAAETNRNPRVSEYYNAKGMLYTLRLKAEALEARHLYQTLKLSDLTLALSTLQSCDTLIDNIRYSSANENDKLEIGASADEVYEDGVAIAQAISEMTINGAKYRELAFYFAEKSKSAVLQESIADAEAKSFAGLPPAVLETENTIKADIALYTQKLAQKPPKEEEAILREKLFQSNQQYQALVKQMEKEYPDYFNLKFNRAAPSSAEVQKQLKEGQVVVSYFIADKRARLYSFILGSNRFKVVHSTLPGDFDRTIRGFTNGIYFMAPDVHAASAQTLSKLLLREVPSAKEIIFIPAGPLSTIPFEALLRGKTPRVMTTENAPYLVRQTSVSYEFSVGLLLQKVSRKAPTNNSILLWAPITFPEKDNLSDLPGTEKEVQSIAGLFVDHAKVNVRTEASEEMLKSSSLSDYGYLHFATHGIVDETAPELSRIFLQGAGKEDGNVFSGEIFNLKLNANLCVLSACQTGLGKYSKGEGVIGLSRALVYAGARSIIVSYWSVADESTAVLMTDFYRILLTKPGVSSRQALQQAKRNMIQQGDHAAPYYWAPFVLIGQ